MKPIIKWTIWQRRWPLFWWSIAVSVFIVLNLAFYPAVRDQADQLNESFRQVPESAKAFITDTGDFMSPEGYLSSQVFYLMLPMILSVLAINLGSSLVGKEENDGTAELLLSRPISRARLLVGKAIAGLAILFTVGLVGMAVTLILSWWVNIEVALQGIAVASLFCLVLSLLFGAIAFYIASLGRTGRLASIGIAALVALGGYIISSLSSIVSWLEWPAKLLPYHYYRPGDILKGIYSWWPLAGYLIAVAVLGVLSWLSFRRRDLS